MTPKNSLARTLYELFSSMRFAVSLLTVLAIASIIGTVLRQNEPYSNYVFQFGDFWFRIFETLGLFDVYHSAGFLTILAFLALSTGLCVARNAPLMLREMRAWRTHASEASLRSFSLRAEWQAPASDRLNETLGSFLSREGYQYRTETTPDATILAAKRGSWRRLGYIFAHTAIVIICIGGLLDGNLPLKFRQLSGALKPEMRDIPASKYSPQSRLTAANPSFRGNIAIPEGETADYIFLNVGEGTLVQELPFAISLKKFSLEHYPTGQPKLYQSDVEIYDKETQQTTTHRIIVNHPITYRGVTLYQADFGDGGSRLTLNGWNLHSPESDPFLFHGTVKQSSVLSNGEVRYQVEFTDFRPFNVRDLDESAETPTGLGSITSSIRDRSKQGGLHNVGPSVRFTVRNAEGKGVEYDNLMHAVPIKGRHYFMSGMRELPGEPFRYMRIPADADQTVSGYMRLKAVLMDDAARAEIVRHFAEEALDNGQKPDAALRARFVESTTRVLELFANGGFDRVAKFIEKKVVKADQERAAQTYMKVLEGAAFQAWRMAQNRAGKPAPALDESNVQFVRDSLNALSDSFFYGAPVYFQLTSFEQRQSSGLQLTRSPGMGIVYLGCVLLIAGVFIMLYVRERRAWILVKPASGEILFALSSNRKTLDLEKEFEQQRQHLDELLKETS